MLLSERSQSERQNYGDNKKIIGCHGFWGREEEMNSGAQEIFRAVKLLCKILKWCIHVNVNFITQKVNPNVNYEL